MPQQHTNCFTISLLAQGYICPFRAATAVSHGTGAERTNTSRKIVTERIYARGTEREEKWNFNEGEECWYTDPYLALSVLALLL